MGNLGVKASRRSSERFKAPIFSRGSSCTTATTVWYSEFHTLHMDRYEIVTEDNGVDVNDDAGGGGVADRQCQQGVDIGDEDRHCVVIETRQIQPLVPVFCFFCCRGFAFLTG